MNSHSAPIVTIVSPCFNQAPYVGEMVHSVRNQTLSNWELIVIDDGSTDRSAQAALAAAKEDSRIRLERTENRGVCAARNHGAAGASEASEYLLFLDADDQLEPCMLGRMTDALSARRRFGMVHCRVTLIDAGGRALPGSPALFPRYVRQGLGIRELSDSEAETPFSAILALTGIIPSAVLLQRSVFARAGVWDEQFGQGFEDTDLFLRMALEAAVCFVPDRLVRHRRHEGQSSSVPGRHDEQGRKLYRRWRNSGGLPDAQAAIVKDAWRFHDRQLAWAQARKAARRYAIHGQPATAARFLGGATRTVLSSWLRPPR